MTEAGGIKFQADRLTGAMSLCPDLEELSLYRNKLRRQRFIGVDKNGIGFGNISSRNRHGGGFFITVSGSAAHETIDQANLVLVKEWHFRDNLVRFEGSATPSAETLTHAAIYEVAPTVNAVLHIHDRATWERLLARGRATGGTAAYGTPAMAFEVQAFLRQRDRLTNAFAMSGHEDGVLAFGRTFAEAHATLMGAPS